MVKINKGKRNRLYFKFNENGINNYSKGFIFEFISNTDESIKRVWLQDLSSYPIVANVFMLDENSLNIPEGEHTLKIYHSPEETTDTAGTLVIHTDFVKVFGAYNNDIIVGECFEKPLREYSVEELLEGLTAVQIAALQKDLDKLSILELQTGLTNSQIMGLQIYKPLSDFSIPELQNGLSPEQMAGVQLYKDLPEYTTAELEEGLTALQIAELQLYKDLEEYTPEELEEGLTNFQKDSLQRYKALDQYTIQELEEGLTQLQKDALQLFQDPSSYSVEELEGMLKPEQIEGLQLYKALGAYTVSELLNGLTEAQIDGLQLYKPLDEYSNQELSEGLTQAQINSLQVPLSEYTVQELEAGLTQGQKDALQLYKALTAYTVEELENGLTPEQIAGLQIAQELDQYTVEQLLAGLTPEQLEGLQQHKSLEDYTAQELENGLTTAQKDALQYALSTYTVQELLDGLTTLQIEGLQLYKPLDEYTVQELSSGLTSSQKEGLQVPLSEYSIEDLESGLTPEQIELLQLYKALYDYSVSELENGLTQSQLDGLQYDLSTYAVSQLISDLTSIQKIGLLQDFSIPFLLENLTTEQLDGLQYDEEDTTPPVITLLGGNITIDEGIPYSEPGFYATDDVDGDVTANVVVTYGGLDINSPSIGTYTIKYNVQDSAGNNATERTRTVTVKAVIIPIVQVVNITSRSARIEWSDFMAEARGYVVQLSLVLQPEQTSLFLELSDLEPDTSYTLRVLAIGDNGEVIGQTPYETFATYPEQNELAPDNISIGSITDNSATVTWDAPEVGELGFNVYLGGVKKNTSLITDEYYNLIDLLPGTVYNVVVSAVYTDNEESSSPAQFSTTGESIGLERNFQETFTVTGGGLYDGQEILVDFYIPLWLRENPSWVGDVPYVVWCHGDGEVGFSISKLREGAGYPRFISQGDDFPYVIISPQTRSPLWSVEFIDKVILFAKTIIPQINENKVGVAGWSGGKPPYMYLNEAPERLAVSLPFSVASGVASENVCASIENGNRVWVFVAKDDPLGTGGHLTYFNNLKNCSSYDPLRHKMTYYTSGGHDCVTRSIRQSPTGGAVEPGYSAVVGGNVHNFIMAAFDDQAPSVPEGLVVVSKTNSNIAVSWGASEDDYAGVSHYVPNIDNVDQTPTTSLSFNFTGLENNTEYDIKVKAVDNNGNESDYSEILKLTTDEFGSPWSPAFDSQDLRISTVEGGITKSGSTLTAVEDLSERGNDINLSGSPAIVTGLNSIDAIHFRELNDERLTIPNAAHLNYTDSQFIGIVAQVDYSLTPDQWAAIVAKGDSTQYQVRRNSNQSNLFYQTGGTSPDNSSTFSPGTNWAIIVACLHNGRKIFRVNGSVISDVTFTGAMSANSFPVTIPGPADKNRFMELKLHELIIATGRDTNVIEKYEGWLAEQYGLRSVLPSEHPYKSASPLT